MIKNIKVFLVIIFCTIDFLVISYINMSYAPVLDAINKSDWWISVWDSLFAIGAIVGAMIFSRWKFIRKYDVMLGVVVAIEGIFAMTFICSRPELITIGMFGLGAINAISVSNFSFYLQTNTEGKLHGRIAGLRQFMISLSSIVLVPFISYQMDQGIKNAVFSMKMICFIGAIGIVISGILTSKNLAKSKIKEEIENVIE